MIIQASNKDYTRLITIWENAVKATHDFLTDNDFEYYKSHLPDYFKQVVLYIYKNGDGVPVGFMGVSGSVLEMLFVDAAYRGCGVGAKLLRYAESVLNIRELYVNEQNKQAVDFYIHMGFHIIGRSASDNDGKPYPLLHLRKAQLSKNR